MSEVRFSAAAQADLLDIVVFIACDTPRAAEDWLAAIEERCELLADHPLTGELRTGKLVGRAAAGTLCHVYQRGDRFFPSTGCPADALEPGRELWVLHPSGDPLPEPAATEATGRQPPPAVLLLDGSCTPAAGRDGIGGPTLDSST